MKKGLLLIILLSLAACDECGNSSSSNSAASEPDPKGPSMYEGESSYDNPVKDKWKSRDYDVFETPDGLKCIWISRAGHQISCDWDGWHIARAAKEGRKVAPINSPLITDPDLITDDYLKMEYPYE